MGQTPTETIEGNKHRQTKTIRQRQKQKLAEDMPWTDVPVV